MLLTDIVDEIVGAIIFTEQAIERLRKIGDQLLHEAGYMDSEHHVVVCVSCLHLPQINDNQLHSLLSLQHEHRELFAAEEQAGALQ